MKRLTHEHKGVFVRARPRRRSQHSSRVNVPEEEAIASRLRNASRLRTALCYHFIIRYIKQVDPGLRLYPDGHHPNVVRRLMAGLERLFLLLCA
jgi:hypothetical protein